MKFTIWNDKKNHVSFRACVLMLVRMALVIAMGYGNAFTVSIGAVASAIWLRSAVMAWRLEHPTRDKSN